MPGNTRNPEPVVLPQEPHEPTRKAVLWDLDGTLADSRDFHWRAWQRALAPEGLAISHTEFLATFGQRNDTILSGWLGNDADPRRIRRIGNAKEAFYREMIEREGITALPGAKEWIERLHEAQWGQAIASSAPRANVEVMSRALGIDGLIEVIVAAEDVRRGKPDPEVFLAAAKRLNVPPERCIVVEDAVAGVEAAKRAGMASIGVGEGDLSGADIVVERLSDLPSDAFEMLLARRKAEV